MGRMRFANGVYRTTIRADANLRSLYAAHFEERMPAVGVLGGVVSIRYPGHRACDWFGRGTGYTAEVALNPVLPWDIDIRGSASRLLADLHGLRIGSFRLAGGAGRVEIVLPVPAGTATVAIRGGASNVAIRLPASVPTRLRVAGGATNLQFGERRIGAAGGDLDLWSHGPTDAASRYDIFVSGGANNVTVQRDRQRTRGSDGHRPGVSA